MMELLKKKKVRIKKMAKLWFENCDGVEREIADVANWSEVWYEINKFIRQCNARKPANAQPFVSYYSRVWQSSDGRSTIDVGSHTEFFHTDLIYKGEKNDNECSSKDLG